jgi:thiazole synthase
MLKIANRAFHSRLFTGTGKFGSSKLMVDAIDACGSELTTLALKRVDIHAPKDDIISPLNDLGVQLLPNTSGAKNAEDAVFASELAREALGTNWVKLEIHPDPKYLMPDPIETLKAAEQLVKKGFVVLPYCHCDPVLSKRLEEVGCAAVMPLGAPIGTNKGLVSREFLHIIIEQSQVPVIIDAGLGAPSHAASAMEMGADAVLVNTAIAISPDPIKMARAFRLSVESGRMAYTAGLASRENYAVASSPLTAFLDDVSHQSLESSE